MSQIIINNKTYYGNNISVKNNVVYVDGKRVDNENDKVITISINGDVDTLVVDVCETIKINGSVTNLKTVSGDVVTELVKNSITTTSGDVEVTGYINGSITTTSGDVTCGDISGNVKTVSGDIKKR
jgi:hypothetical protein